MASTEEKALIALLIAAFLLSDSEVTRMASLIAVARIDSAKASYAKASDTAGVEGDWQPSSGLQQTMTNTSRQDADSIANTYKDDLTAVATAFVASWLVSHGTLDGCESAARKEIATWATDRAKWKSEQIANYTGGSGANTGTNQFIDDLQDGEFEDLNPDDFEVTVLPETSSNDICSTYAGEIFEISEYDTLPSFPLHGGCPHRIVVQMK